MKINNSKLYRHCFRCFLCAVCFILISGECNFYLDPPRENGYDPFEVINNSTEIIYVGYRFPDPELFETKTYITLNLEDFHEINPNESKVVFRYVLPKENVYPVDNVYHDGFHQFYIFKKSTLDKYTVEELIEGNIFDKRIIISYDDLKANDFKIVYTGD